MSPPEGGRSSLLRGKDDSAAFLPKSYGSTVVWGDIEALTHPNDSPSRSHSAKSIGILGSVAIAVNSLAGPAILHLPATYQEAGIIPTTLALIIVGLLSSFCSMHMANVVSKVPGNRFFDKEVEFSEPFRVLWGHCAFVATQICFYLCTVCLNVAAIVDTAEVVDTFLGHSGWGSSALQLDGFNLTPVHWIHGPCTRHEVRIGQCMPFEADDQQPIEYGDYLVTLGYLIAAAAFLPICLMELKENTNFQIFGFIVLLATSVQFVASFCTYGLKWRHVPLWGHDYDRMLGVILFNFSLVVAVPAWLHEKKTGVDVPTVVFGSTVLTTLLYVLVGLGGALAIPDVNPNLLAPLVSGAFGVPLRISASFFAFIIIGLDIPLFSVLTRYNLVNSGLCNETLANWLVVYIPWGISWTFYQGTAVSSLLSWGGVLFTSLVAFILPLALSLYTLLYRVGDEDGSVDVYGGFIRSIQGKKRALWALLVTAIFGVIYSIIGLV